jgi:hypothetical protein
LKHTEYLISEKFSELTGIAINPSKFKLIDGEVSYMGSDMEYYTIKSMVRTIQEAVER